jgi:hypothetical protein
MIAVLLGLLMLARVLRVRVGVLAVLVAGWGVVLWLQTAAPPGPHLALVLGVCTLVATMLYADRPWTRRG